MRNTALKLSKDSRCVEGEWDMEVGPEVSGRWKSSCVLASSISGVKKEGYLLTQVRDVLDVERVTFWKSHSRE